MRSAERALEDLFAVEDRLTIQMHNGKQPSMNSDSESGCNIGVLLRLPLARHRHIHPSAVFDSHCQSDTSHVAHLTLFPDVPLTCSKSRKDGLPDRLTAYRTVHVPACLSGYPPACMIVITDQETQSHDITCTLVYAGSPLPVALKSRVACLASLDPAPITYICPPAAVDARQSSSLGVLLDSVHLRT